MDKIGILDPLGKSLNPLNNEKYSDEYKTLAKTWSKLPAYGMAEQIIKDIQDNQVLLIISGTGSGKTVLLPKYILHAFGYKGKFGITLPKTAITESSAKYAAKTLDVKLGEQVGYIYRGSNKNHIGKDSNLIYATDGTIVARLLNDKTLKDFDGIIIDEAHERKINIDLLLYLLKETLKIRPEFKLIIMSATIDSSIFKKYYKDYKFKKIDIGGKTNYPIKSIFLDQEMNYDKRIDKGFDILIKCLKNKPKSDKNSDILFFLSSKNETIDMCKKLDKYIKQNEKQSCDITCDGDIYCASIYSGINEKKKQLAIDKELYKKNTKYYRKVVMATNMAESSMTIDGIDIVIDLGYELNSSFDPISRARELKQKLITRAQAKQRMGRTGRTQPGTCYHLYTEKEFNNMQDFPKPDILTSDITMECLKLLSRDYIDNTTNLKKILNSFVDPPEKKYIDSAFLVLSKYGLLNNTKISPLGKTVAKLHTDIYSALALYYARLYNCTREMVKIIAIMDVTKNNLKSLFLIPFAKNPSDKKFIRKNQDKIMLYFKHKYGDHLSMLALFDKFNKYNSKYHNDQKKMDKLAEKYYINMNVMKKIKKEYNRLKQKISTYYNEPDFYIDDIVESVNKLHTDDRIMFCLINSYLLNTAEKHKNGYITPKPTSIVANISKSSFVNFSKIKPKQIFYTELFATNDNNSFNIISRIPPNMAI